MLTMCHFSALLGTGRLDTLEGKAASRNVYIKRWLTFYIGVSPEILFTEVLAADRSVTCNLHVTLRSA